jgi:nucleotidyltransferase/DNA polymerase involved in DNA repair
MLGEYDFSDEKIKVSVGILSLKSLSKMPSDSRIKKKAVAIISI